jgi:hypothetical protein
MFVAATAQLMEAGLDLADMSLKTGEMTAAAGSVIGARVGLMVAAARNPLSFDYAEFGRMVPEKVQAFSEAGAALAEEWWSLQRDLGDYMLYLGRAMTRGRAPLPSDVIELVERTSTHGARLAASTIGAAGAALAPVHRAATSNARRLAERRT